MTAKITLERAGASRVRVNAVIDIDVSGLNEILPILFGVATHAHFAEGALSGDGQDMLTVEEAAEILHVSRDKAYHLIRTGQLRSVKIGKLRRISRAWLQEFVDRTQASQADTKT